MRADCGVVCVWVRVVCLCCVACVWVPLLCWCVCIVVLRCDVRVALRCVGCIGLMCADFILNMVLRCVRG